MTISRRLKRAANFTIPKVQHAGWIAFGIVLVGLKSLQDVLRRSHGIRISFTPQLKIVKG